MLGENVIATVFFLFGYKVPSVGFISNFVAASSPSNSALPFTTCMLHTEGTVVLLEKRMYFVILCPQMIYPKSTKSLLGIISGVTILAFTIML